MAIQSIHTYKEVRSSFGPWWRLEVSNWGNRGALADTTSIVAPIDNPPDGGAAAIFIGPDSTADQVIVNYVDPVPPPFATLFPNPGVLNQLRMTCGINEPFVDVPGPYFFSTAFSTQFTDLYFKDGVTAAQAFGTANPAFEAPLLQVISYLTPPTTPPSGKRNTMQRVRSTAAIGGQEATVAIWPVMGRKKISVYMRVDGTLVANPRIGAIADFVNTSLGLPAPVQFEDTISPAAVGALDATTGAQFSFTTEQPMQWIAVYATQTAGAGTIFATLIASD